MLMSSNTQAQHPGLTLTKGGVEKIMAGLNEAPLFKKELQLVQNEIDRQIERGIDVPIPKDMAGGYTHEQHKNNYKWMYKAGNLYQFTRDDKYAEYAKQMLFEYSKMYPSLSLHPTNRSYATGKIFWQCLNDANWLVFASQAYDCIYDYLSKQERNRLEAELFVPFANFLSEENPRFFNRIHNHSTWANAAVGLIALAMDNDTLLEKALYGLKSDGINPEEIDNDGGFIKKEGVLEAGFLAQLDLSFSPEGYFSEGPYYQRYAIFPFLVFGHALHNKKPDLKIFEYRDQILLKATKSLLNLTDPHGNFFPINDAQKGMNFTAFELITAVDLMCYIFKDESSLLNWASMQRSVAFNEAGYYVAQKLKDKSQVNPIKESVYYGDGVNGMDGGVSVLRQGNTDLFFKFSSHGMGHGHFDRLSYSLFDSSGEAIQDYGAVRWVNVDQKAGGRYLPENKTFGKQTVAHNTVVINETSQCEGKVKIAENHSPDLYHKDFTNPNYKIISARDDDAYANVDMHRILVLLEDEDFHEPLLIDLFAVNAQEKVKVDLPLWYQGALMQTSFNATKSTTALEPLGSSYGYQHIWKESKESLEAGNFKLNWFGNNRFYTLTGFSNASDEFIMGRAGANDPNYNLRNDPVFIQRKSNIDHGVFFNLIESHGVYSTVTEIPINPYGQIVKSEIHHADEKYIICSFSNEVHQWFVYFAREDSNPDANHQLTLGEDSFSWKGTCKLVKTKI